MEITGTIAPTPRNRVVGAAADALAALQKFGNKASVPSAVPLVGGQGLGDLFIGSIAPEVDNLSYGDLPMVMPQQSNVPAWKPGRRDGAVDVGMAAALPLFKGTISPLMNGAKRADLAESFASRNVKMRHAPDIQQRPFELDYPQAGPDASGWMGRQGDPLTQTRQGTPVSAEFLAGRRTVGGGDEGLSEREMDALASGLLAVVNKAKPNRQMGRDLGLYGGQHS